MTLDLTGVECFVAVARFRHFGEAAADLGVSVSSVTKRLQRLEVALGVPLVVRDSTGFQGLTPAGSRFVQLAPELHRVLLRGLPDSWYFAHHRAADTRPELHTALGLMGDFTASINRAALP